MRSFLGQASGSTSFYTFEGYTRRYWIHAITHTVSVKVRQLMEALLERAETAKCVISLTPLAALNGDESPHFTHLMTSVKRSTHQT